MKRKTLITSILVIVVCLALISGSTYSLFTSESSVNIAVTSGKVDVSADVTDLKVYSATADTNAQSITTVAGEIQTGPFAGTYYYQGPLANNTFANGGTAAWATDTKVLTIDKITPGDKVTLNVSVTNNSNVKAKYRVRVNALESINAVESLKLFEGLAVSVGGTALEGVIRVSPWTQLDVNAVIPPIPVEIVLPLEAGNEYQNLKTEIQITVEAVQDNAATNTELETINAFLATKSPTTMYAAVKSLADNSVLGLTSYAEAFAKVESYLWNVDTNQFYAESDATDFAYKYFKVYKEMPTPQTYSIYAGSEWTATTVPGLTVGFDAGVTSGITSITYDRSTATYGQEVVIRTNSSTTALTVNAPKDVIRHYDTVGSLNIIAAANSSYHEFGQVAFAEIAKGRIVLESGSEIKYIHVNANENANGFEEVIIKDNGAENLPEAITRDQVDVSEAKPVVTVESGSTSETVYVYPYTDAQETRTGTTEKTDTQNTSVVSALGQLVLDNGNDAGEKAMSNNEKTSAKQEVVEVAQNEEEIEKAENAGYEITHHEALAPTCAVDGHTAYDSYYVNNEEQKVGYKVIPATGRHTKAENPVYAHNFNGQWQHATQCAVCGQWIVEYCADEDDNNACDACGHQMYIEVYSISDLVNSEDDIVAGSYKLMADISLTKMTYIKSVATIDLNGHTFSNYPLNSPADAQFRSYTGNNATMILNLKDSSAGKTGMFISRFGNTFYDGSNSNKVNPRFIINCEDGVTINTCYDYQGNEMNSFSGGMTYFLNNISKNVEINNAHLIIGAIAMVNSGYTVTFKNCTIESRNSSGMLQGGSGNIVYDGCTITTVMQSSSGNVLDSSDPNVTFINGTTVNGVTK